jgi:S1-C subfamily serine protease
MDLRAGDRLELTVEGQPRTIALEAVAYPSVTAERVRVLSDIELITVTPQIQVERNLTSADGALIADISSELQSQLGLGPGDVIVQINRTRIRSAEDAASALRIAAGDGADRDVLRAKRRLQHAQLLLEPMSDPRDP